MDAAERYERLHPQTGISDAQKQERMERADFREEVRTLRRTTRTRGIVVPDLPWKREETPDASAA